MKKGKNSLNSFIGLLSIGITSGVCIAVGLFIGYQVDKYFLIGPWGVSFGTMFGLCAGIMETYKQIQKELEKNEKEKSSHVKHETK